MDKNKKQDDLLEKLSNYSGGTVKKQKPIPEKPKKNKDIKGGD